MSTQQPTAVHIALDASDRDDEEQWAATQSLRSSLLDLDEVSLDAGPTGTPPPGAKGVGDIAGWLVVHLGAGGLSSLLSTVQSWAARSRCEVELGVDGDTLRINGASPETQERIVDAWLTRHAGRS